jgi:hypothetical protein
MKHTCRNCLIEVSTSELPENDVIRKGFIYCKKCWKKDKEKIKQSLKDQKKVIRKEVGEFEIGFP